MKYIKTRFKVSSINSTARITSQYYTLLISIKNCRTSTYLTDYINVLRLNSADDCLRCFTIAQLTALRSCYKLVNTVQPTHRGATILNATRRPPHNIAVIQQQLYTEYCFTPHNELVEYTLNSLFDSHISRISSPLLSYPMPIIQCPDLYIRCFPSSRLRAKRNGSINRHDVVTIRITSTNHNIAITTARHVDIGCLQLHWLVDSLYIYMNHGCTHNVTYDDLTLLRRKYQL